ATSASPDTMPIHAIPAILLFILSPFDPWPIRGASALNPPLLAVGANAPPQHGRVSDGSETKKFLTGDRAFRQRRSTARAAAVQQLDRSVGITPDGQRQGLRQRPQHLLDLRRAKGHGQPLVAERR